MRKIQSDHIRTWLVTGAYSGVGEELCFQLLERGYFVVACSRRKPRFSHKNALNLSLDVTDAQAVEQAVAMAVAHFGRVDVLCNNAGISAKCTIEEETLDHMKQVMETNFFGTFNMMHAMLPHFRRNGHGTIINNTSGAGLFPRPYGAAYVPSKYATEGLTDMCRCETASFCRVMAFELTNFFGTEISKMASTRTNDAGHPEYANCQRPFKRRRQTTNVLSVAMRQLIEVTEEEKMPAHMMLGSVAAAEYRAKELLKDASTARKKFQDALYSPARLWRDSRSTVYPIHKQRIYTGIVWVADSTERVETELSLYALYKKLEQDGESPIIIHTCNMDLTPSYFAEDSFLTRSGVRHTREIHNWHVLNMELTPCRRLLVWQNRPLKEDEMLAFSFFASEGCPISVIRCHSVSTGSTPERDMWNHVTETEQPALLRLLPPHKWDEAMTEPPKAPSPYCAVYLTRQSPEGIEVLPEDERFELISGDSADRWLSCISRAASVVTDSSMAVEYALLRQKPFLYIGSEPEVCRYLQTIGEGKRVWDKDMHSSDAQALLRHEILAGPLTRPYFQPPMNLLGANTDDKHLNLPKLRTRHLRLVHRVIRAKMKGMARAFIAYTLYKSASFAMPAHHKAKYRERASRARAQFSHHLKWLCAYDI